jgi:hypothetical protein
MANWKHMGLLGDPTPDSCLREFFCARNLLWDDFAALSAIFALGK